MKQPKRKYLLIINPISGTSRKTDLPETAYSVLGTDDSELYFVYTNGSGHAARIVADIKGQGFDTVIAVGGDGTINEIAHAVCHTDLSLGIVPVGSGNGLARSLEIPLEPEAAFEVIRHGHIRAIDSCDANGTPFFVTFGVGFDAQVTASYDQKGFRGPLSYVLSTIEEFIKHTPLNYRLHLNGQVLEQKAFLITCANADQYGNNAYIAPDALLDDGLFDVVVVRDLTLLQAPQMAVRLFSNRISENAFIDIYRTDRLVIEREQPGLVQVDGESMEMGRSIEITIAKQQLSVITPLRLK